MIHMYTNCVRKILVMIIVLDRKKITIQESWIWLLMNDFQKSQRRRRLYIITKHHVELVLSPSHGIALSFLRVLCMRRGEITRIAKYYSICFLFKKKQKRILWIEIKYNGIIKFKYSNKMWTRNKLPNLKSPLYIN